METNSDAFNLGRYLGLALTRLDVVQNEIGPMPEYMLQRLRVVLAAPEQGNVISLLMDIDCAIEHGTWDVGDLPGDSTGGNSPDARV